MKINYRAIHVQEIEIIANEKTAKETPAKAVNYPLSIRIASISPVFRIRAVFVQFFFAKRGITNAVVHAGI